MIDTHVHVFEKLTGKIECKQMTAGRNGRVRIGDDERQIMPPSFEYSNSTAETLLAHMADAGIEKAVLVSNPFYGYHNDYTKKCMERYPGSFAGIALVDIFGGEEAAEQLTDLWREGLQGLKIETCSSIQYRPEAELTDLCFEPIWSCLNAQKQPLLLHLFRESDLCALNVLAGKYPDICYVVCHLGADACFAHQAGNKAFEILLAVMKEKDNIMADLSTVPEYTLEPYPFLTAQKRIEKAYRELGPERMMWGTDYPGMLKYATYRQLLAYFADGCQEIPSAHKDLILGKNAQRLFFEN